MVPLGRTRSFMLSTVRMGLKALVTIMRLNSSVESLRREGLVDLEIGVLGKSGPEVRVQTQFRDHYVGAARASHALFTRYKITAKRYAACGHVVASRRGREKGPVDEALTGLGLSRAVIVVVPSFRAALAIASVSDLVALATNSFFNAAQGLEAGPGSSSITSFPLPVRTAAITVSQMWHPRFDADPAHRWLRALVLATCSELRH
jgi:DNA-binding transcriptional LysR family regulator